MSNSMKPASFDYSLVAKDVKGKLLCHAAEIRKHGESHVKAGIELGRCLSDARALLDNETSFRSWVESECGFSRSSAYNYIAVYEQFGECPTVGHIELGALYQLTKSDRAKTKALRLADKGVRVTQSMAKELVSECSGKDDATATKAQEQDRRPPRSGTDKPAVVSESVPAEERCPNCAGTKWTEDEFGKSCSRCHHPYGEPAGEVDDDRIGVQRSKTVKTAEALLRAFDDLQLLLAHDSHEEAVRLCKAVLKLAKGWK